MEVNSEEQCHTTQLYEEKNSTACIRKLTRKTYTNRVCQFRVLVLPGKYDKKKLIPGRRDQPKTPSPSKPEEDVKLFE